jgi:hypothetical protein
MAPQQHHHLLRVVRFGRDPAVVEVGNRGEEALGSEPLGQILDVRLQAPPLLNEHDARPERRIVGSGHEGAGSGAVHGQVDHLGAYDGHGCSLLCVVRPPGLPA